MSGNAVSDLLDVYTPKNEIRCYAVKVRVRAEITIGRQLHAKGYKVLVPSYTIRRNYSDRLKKLDCALFPGYVFVWLDVRELLPLLSTPGVDYVVKSGGMLRPLPVEEIAIVEALTLMPIGCQPCPKFRAGQRVRIETGPLRAQRGILIRLGNSDRVVISVDSISSSVSVTVSDTMITVIE